MRVAAARSMWRPVTPMERVTGGAKIEAGKMAGLTRQAAQAACSGATAGFATLARLVLPAREGG